MRYNIQLWFNYDSSWEDSTEYGTYEMKVLRWGKGSQEKKKCKGKKNLRKNLREKDQTHIETFVWNTFEINKDLSWFVFFEFGS